MLIGVRLLRLLVLLNDHAKRTLQWFDVFQGKPLCGKCRNSLIIKYIYNFANVCITIETCLRNPPSQWL